MSQRLVDREAPEGMKWKIKIFPVVNGVEVIVQLRKKGVIFSTLHMQMESLISKAHMEQQMSAQEALIGEIRLMQDLMYDEEKEGARP